MVAESGSIAGLRFSFNATLSIAIPKRFVPPAWRGEHVPERGLTARDRLLLAVLIVALGGHDADSPDAR